MKKGTVVGLSILALILFGVALFYQVTHIDEPTTKKSTVVKRTNLMNFVMETIEDLETPTSASVDEATTEDGSATQKAPVSTHKEIESETIISFFLDFSTLYEEGDISMGKKQWKLRADFDGETVLGTYKSFDSMSNDDRRFEADAQFMNKLMEIIKTYDLASFDGLDNETKGISDEYGATFSIMFESGESLYARDNEENFIPLEAEDAFVQLFAEACAKGEELIGVSLTSETINIGAGEEQGFVRYPVLHLGRTDAFDKIDELKYPSEDGLKKAITDINSYEKDVALSAKSTFEEGKKSKDAYYEGMTFVTRNDSAVLAMYVREHMYSGPGTDYTIYRTYNVDCVSGNHLQFLDAFRDSTQLSLLIESELKKKYPQVKFDKDIHEKILKSITENDGDVCFCLGNGFAQFFINEYLVDDNKGGYNITVPFADHPELISNFYKKYPLRTFTKLDYGVDYYLRNGISFRMEYKADEDDIIWRGIVDKNVTEAPFYGYPPEVYLTCDNGAGYLFINVPTGDVSFHGMVYELTKDGLKTSEENGDMGLKVVEDTTLDPDYVLMNINEVIDGTVCFMYPKGAYCIDTDGFPVPVLSEYKLVGEKVTIRKSGRYNPRNPDAAYLSGGMFYLAEGTEVTPYATDLENYIDFITGSDDGNRIIRFVIDKFSADMKLDNFGELDKVFK